MTNRNNIIEIFRESPTPASILVKDKSGFIIRDYNSSYLTLLGLASDQLQNRTLPDVFLKDQNNQKKIYYNRLITSLKKVSKNKKADILDIVRLDTGKKGNRVEKYWKVENTPVLSKEREIEFIYSTSTDITQRVLNERVNNLMLHNSEESFVYTDRKLKIINFNSLFADSYKSLFGIDIQKGTSLLDYTQPDRIEIIEDYCKRVLEDNVIEDTVSFTSKDNQERFYKVKYKAAKDENDDIIGIFISILESTEEKKAKFELEKNEARFRALVENGQDVVVIFSEDFEPFYISQTITNVLDYTIEEVMKMDVSEIIHPDDMQGSYESFQEALKNPGVSLPGYTARLKHRDGSWRWVEATVTNMLHDPGIGGVIDNFRDITKQRQSEEELKASLNEKNTLLAEIHHRVKNNLAVVSGMMQLQAFDSESDELKSKLMDSVVRIKTMAVVHELLYQSNSFSKLEFSETLIKLVQTISESLQATDNITVDIQSMPVHLNINQAIPASLIVNEVITNVYKHAFKKNQKGKIFFSLSEKENHVYIEITDNGIGIDKDINSADSKKSLGLHIIKVLSQQIYATHTYKKTATGTSFFLDFEKKDTKSGIGSARLIS